MKTISTFFMSSLILTTFAFAQAPVFTTVSSTGESVFAGVKKESKGSEPETYLLKVSGDSLTAKKIPLPKELLHREVVALIPAENNSVLVMTQRTVEQGDMPQLHAFDPESSKWKKLAEVDCVSFAKLKVEKNAVIFSCLKTNENGEEVETQKRVSVNSLKLAQTGSVTLPKAKAQEKSLSAELVGEAFEWKELKVSAGKSKTKSFAP